MKHDGSGSATVYTDNVKESTMEAEGNPNLKFTEPYLLAMAADEEGRTGC